MQGSRGKAPCSTPWLATPIALVSFLSAAGASFPWARKPAIATLKSGSPPEANEQWIRRVLFCCHLPVHVWWEKLKQTHEWIRCQKMSNYGLQNYHLSGLWMEKCRGTLYRCSLQLIPESLISREKGKGANPPEQSSTAVEDAGSPDPIVSSSLGAVCALYFKTPCLMEDSKRYSAIHYIDCLCLLSAPWG